MNPTFDTWIDIAVRDDSTVAGHPDAKFQFVKKGRTCGLGAWSGKFCGRLINHTGPHINVDPTLVNAEGPLWLSGGVFGEEPALTQPDVVIGFTGFARSGKDTAAEILAAVGFERLAFADPLREALYNLNPPVHFVVDLEYDYSGNSCWGMGAKPPISGATVISTRVRELVDRMGWDEAKTAYPEVRELLQRLGTGVGRNLFGENFWSDQVLKKMVAGHKYAITDCRFPNEVEAIRSVGGKVYRVVRPGVEPVNTHVSDTGIASLDVDGEILNDGNLQDFGIKVLQLLDKVFD